MQAVLSSVFIIVGTIIGAGFASGQEISAFFNRFDEAGLYGMIFACVLFCIIITYILTVKDKYKIDSYDELIGGNKFLLILEEVFLFICFCVMIAGIGAFFDEQLGIHHWLGSLFGCLVCYLIFLYKYKGLEVLNTILVPFIVVGILLVSFGRHDASSFEQINYTLPNFFANNFITSSILYVGYNSLGLIPILVKLKTGTLSNVKKAFVAFLSSLVLGLVGISLFVTIYKFFPAIMVYELPTLKLASMMGSVTKGFFGIVILCAILTTAISCGFAFIEMNDKKYMIRSSIMCLVAFFISNIGFSELVNTIFPIFGYIGILEILVIVFYSMGKKKRKGSIDVKE